ncbi:MAG: hypothetical protein ABSA75_14650 [Candidatus Bathyarchaeia archaeon]
MKTCIIFIGGQAKTILVYFRIKILTSFPDWCFYEFGAKYGSN